MKVFVTKANNYKWYKIEEYNTMEDLYKMIDRRKHPVIIRKNGFFYHNPIAFKFWEGKEEDIPEVMNCKLEVQIYNGYVE